MHVVIDLETLGRPPDGVFFQLGWCRFDPVRGFLDEPGSVAVDIQNALSLGMTLDVATVDWWHGRSGLYREIRSRRAVGLDTALRHVDEVARDAEGVWARGPTFDVTILEAAYRAVRRPPPWHYRTPRCVRTLEAVVLAVTGRDLASEFADRFAGPQHDAGVDARHHAEMVCEGYRALGARR